MGQNHIDKLTPISNPISTDKSMNNSLSAGDRVKHEPSGGFFTVIRQDGSLLDVDEDSRRLRVSDVNLLHPGDIGHRAGEPIRARTYDDNHEFDIQFDARLWFEQASQEEVAALAGVDWAGDYAADVVAEYFDGGEDNNPSIAEMFAHKKDGFEVQVDSEDALMWLAVYRPAWERELPRE